MKRREVLSGGSALLLFIAGCSSQQSPNSVPDSKPNGSGDASPTIACPSATPTPSDSLFIPFQPRNESEQKHDVTLTVLRGQFRKEVFSWSFTLNPQEDRAVVKEVFEGSEVPSKSGTETELHAETHQGQSTTATISGGIKRWRTLSDQGIGMEITGDDMTFEFGPFGDDGFVPDRCD